MPASSTFVRHYLPITSAIGVVLALVFYFRRLPSLRRLGRVGGRIGAAVAPRFLTGSTFLAGLILLFSGATPAAHRPFSWVDDLLPLPVFEAAHFIGSIFGLGLLILSRGIQRRLDAAWHLSVALLGGGILFSLIKGEYEEAIFLAVMLGFLLPNGKYFRRRSSLIDERFTPGWIAAIVAAVAGSWMLAWMSYHERIDSPLEVFWIFEADRSAPRSVRAMAGVAVALLAFAVLRLLRPSRVRAAVPTATDLERAVAIADTVPEASAQLVTLGDKALLFNGAGTGFVMYGVHGRSWVSMGDPVAPLGLWPELIQDFVSLAIGASGWPVFYKVGREDVALYLDFGLSVVKLGEEARVALPDFSLEGPARRNLRRVWRKAIDEGASFELLQGADVAAAMPKLRAISDSWLTSKSTREKGFSLGRFDDAYVRRFPVGVVRIGGEIVAFATVWRSGAHAELEVDLMRFSATAPAGIMRYLLTEFMLWGRGEGFRWFNLGMAPLAGLRSSAMAPLWNQIGITLYGRGERFYNFQGIRAFKEWFHPEWQPRYLASPGGPLRPVILANIAALISGGYEGMIRK